MAPDGEVAVAGADETGQRGTGADNASEAAPLPQQDDRRVLLARAVVTLLRDVPGDPQPRGQQRGVVPRPKPVMGREAGGDVLAHGLVQRAQQLLDPAERRDAVHRAAQRDEAEPDGLDLPGGEVVEPRLVEQFPTAGLRVPAVAHPQLRVLRGVLQLTLHHPAVEPGRVEPRRDPLGPGLAVAVLPVAQQLRDTAGFEHRADAGHEPADDVVAGQTGVPVRVRGHRRRAGRDDERRVAHDEVEPLGGGRLEQIALPELGADAVQRQVEPREGEGAHGEVGRDDGGGVPARVQGLHAAAGADVEDATDGRPERAARQRDRGSADTEHVLGAERASGRELPQVGGDPPGGAARGVLGGVRLEVDERADLVLRALAGGIHESEPGGAVDPEPGQGGGEPSPGDRPSQHEGGGEGRDRVAPAAEGAQRRDRLRAGHRGLRDGAHEVMDGVDRPVGEVGAQGVDVSSVRWRRSG
jgi:hypothetical protein